MDWLNSPTREGFRKKKQRVRTVKVRNARKAEERRKGKTREDGGKGHTRKDGRKGKTRKDEREGETGLIILSWYSHFRKQMLISVSCTFRK